MGSVAGDPATGAWATGVPGPTGAWQARPVTSTPDPLPVDALLDRLTLDEKLSLLAGADMWHTRPVERLGIGAMKLTDGPAGARGDGLLGTGTPTACVPSGSCLGATWDPELVGEIGALLGDEARAKGAHVLLAPTINLHRTPLGGRNFESFSEDPLLTGRLAAAFVRGVQSRGVATTPKHLVANDSEFERNTIDVRADERTLREVYLRPFEDAVVRGGAWGVMSAYNRLGGTYCSENHWLLTRVLRDDWGFDGFVVSDWFAARSTVDSMAAGLDLEMPGPGIHYRADRLRAAVDEGTVDEATIDRAVRRLLVAFERTGVLDGTGGGVETELDRPADRALVRRAAAAGTVLLTNDGLLPLDESSLASVAVIGPNAWHARIMGGGSATVAPYRAVSPVEALTERLAGRAEVRWAAGCDIDRVTPPLRPPLLTGRVTLELWPGHVDPGDPGCGEPTAVLERSQMRFVFFDSPAPGIPAEAFTWRARATAVPRESGPHAVRLVQAGRARVLLDGGVVLDGTTRDIPRGDDFFGFASEEIEAVVDLVAGRPVEVVLEATNRDAVLLAGAQVGLVSLVERDLLAEAEELAATSDVAVVVVGTNEDWETEGRDRDLFALPGDQPELVRRVSAVNQRTVVVINTGGVHELDWLDEPAAVLSVGFAGQELGHALVDVLFGDVDPGGRMASTVPARLEHHPAFLNHPGENSRVVYGENLHVGHRWYDTRGIDPLVPFGHGLSYTRFELDGVVVEPATTSVRALADSDGVVVGVDLTNVGDRPGSEVVQVYLEAVEPRLRRPRRELAGFAKIHLDPGRSTRVEVVVEPRSFAVYDPGDREFARLRRGGPVPAAAGHERREEAGWWLDPGVFRLHVGRSSRDLAHTVEFVSTGEAVRLG